MRSEDELQFIDALNNTEVCFFENFKQVKEILMLIILGQQV